MNPFLLLRHLGYVRARGVQPRTLALIVLGALRVLDYLHAAKQLSPRDLLLMADHSKWLSNMLRDLNKMQPVHMLAATHPAETLDQQANGVSAQQLLAKMREQFDSAMQQFPAAEAGDVGKAVYIMEVAAVCLAGGAFMPCIRVAPTCDILFPRYERCCHSDCHHRDKCRGNR